MSCNGRTGAHAFPESPPPKTDGAEPWPPRPPPSTRSPPCPARSPWPAAPPRRGRDCYPSPPGPHRHVAPRFLSEVRRPRPRPPPPHSTPRSVGDAGATAANGRPWGPPARRTGCPPRPGGGRPRAPTRTPGRNRPGPAPARPGGRSAAYFRSPPTPRRVLPRSYLVLPRTTDPFCSRRSSNARACSARSTLSWTSNLLSVWIARSCAAAPSASVDAAGTFVGCARRQLLPTRPRTRYGT